MQRKRRPFLYGPAQAVNKIKEEENQKGIKLLFDRTFSPATFFLREKKEKKNKRKEKRIKHVNKDPSRHARGGQHPPFLPRTRRGPAEMRRGKLLPLRVHMPQRQDALPDAV